MTDTETRPGTDEPGPEEARMQGRQVFAYFGLLFLFLILTRALLTELHSLFDLAVFPKLASGVQQALDYATEFDNVLNTIYSLLYAFLFSLPVAIVYRVTKDDGKFDPALAQTIVLLAMVVTAVMIVISGDLARAFGLAGVVGAVRFRNSLDDAKDAVFVFLAIAIGMTCGARAYTVALWTSLIMTSTLYFMWYFHFGRLPGRILASHKGGKAKKKDRKDDGEAPSLPPASAETQDRVQRMIEQQYRLVQLASMSREMGEKKANAGLVVEAKDLARAQNHVETVLASSGGQWQLANLVASEGGRGTLEFVGRLSKGGAPGALVQALLQGDVASFIAGVEFRSLKGQRAVEAPDPRPGLGGPFPADGAS